MTPDDCCTPKIATRERGPAGPPGPAGPSAELQAGYPITINGMLKGEEGELQAAVPGDDYATPSQITFSYLSEVSQLTGGVPGCLDAITVSEDDVGTAVMFKLASADDEMQFYELAASSDPAVPPGSIDPIGPGDFRWLKMDPFRADATSDATDEPDKILKSDINGDFTARRLTLDHILTSDQEGYELPANSYGQKSSVPRFGDQVLLRGGQYRMEFQAGDIAYELADFNTAGALTKLGELGRVTIPGAEFAAAPESRVLLEAKFKSIWTSVSALPDTGSGRFVILVLRGENQAYTLGSAGFQWFLDPSEYSEINVVGKYNILAGSPGTIGISTSSVGIPAHLQTTAPTINTKSARSIQSMVSGAASTFVPANVSATDGEAFVLDIYAQNSVALGTFNMTGHLALSLE